METYQREAAIQIRLTESRVSILADRFLVALWGMFSCERSNRFWVPCNPAQIGRFLEWSEDKKIVSRLIDDAHRESQLRAEHRAFARSVRPKPRFVVGPDGTTFADPASQEGALRAGAAYTGKPGAWATVDDLVTSVNRWCRERGVSPTGRGIRPSVDVAFIRYCCRNSLMDRPGSPDGGRVRGFSEKHFCQLRMIRLLQARSLSTPDINTMLHGRTLDQLHELERAELATSEHRFVERVPETNRLEDVHAGA